MDSESKKSKICSKCLCFLFVSGYYCILMLPLERGDLWLKLAIPVIFMKPSKRQYLEAMADLPGSHKTTILLLGVIH